MSQLNIGDTVPSPIHSYFYGKKFLSAGGRKREFKLTGALTIQQCRHHIDLDDLDLGPRARQLTTTTTAGASSAIASTTTVASAC